MEHRSKLALVAIAVLLVLASTLVWKEVVEYGGDGGRAFIWVAGDPPELVQDEVAEIEGDARGEREPAKPVGVGGRVEVGGGDADEESVADADAPDAASPSLVTAMCDTTDVPRGRLRIVVRSSRAPPAELVPPAWLYHESDESVPGGRPARRRLDVQLGRYADACWEFEIDYPSDADESDSRWVVDLGTSDALPHAIELGWMMNDVEWTSAGGAGGRRVEFDLDARQSHVELGADWNPDDLDRHVRDGPALWGDAAGAFRTPEADGRRLALFVGHPFRWARRSARHRTDESFLSAVRCLEIGDPTVACAAEPLAHIQDWWWEGPDPVLDRGRFVAGRRPIFTYDLEAAAFEVNRWQRRHVVRGELVVLPREDVTTRVITRLVAIAELPDDVDELHVVGFGRVLAHGEPSVWRHVVPLEHDEDADGVGTAHAELHFDRLHLALPERVMLWCDGVRPWFFDAASFFEEEGVALELAAEVGSGGVVVGRFRRAAAPPPRDGDLVAPARGFRVRAAGERPIDVSQSVWWSHHELEGRALRELGWREVTTSPDGRRYLETTEPFSVDLFSLVEPELAEVRGEQAELEWSFTAAGPGVVELSILER